MSEPTVDIPPITITVGDKQYQNLHHREILGAARDCVASWVDETHGMKRRCESCWLLLRKCYCEKLKEMYGQRISSGSAGDLESDENASSGSNKNPKVEVVMYYNYVEIGRSVNTAHIMKILYPEIYRELVYGNFEEEVQLFAQIENDLRDGVCDTCILYPSSDAIGVSEWLERIQSRRASGETVNSAQRSRSSIRMILIDGTYSQANRQYKYLVKCIEKYGLNIPFVKLDIGEEGCHSSLEGIIRQPGKNKVCTYQAAVMALGSVGVSAETCQQMQHGLDQWLGYILESKIKLGKSRVQLPLGLAPKSEATPSASADSSV